MIEISVSVLERKKGQRSQETLDIGPLKKKNRFSRFAMFYNKV